jgi:hypothetical protein
MAFRMREIDLEDVQGLFESQSGKAFGNVYNYCQLLLRYAPSTLQTHSLLLTYALPSRTMSGDNVSGHEGCSISKKGVARQR